MTGKLYDYNLNKSEQYAYKRNFQNTELNKAVIYFTYQCWLFPTIKKGSWIELLLASSTSIKPLKRSECWRLYAVPTARFIFTAKKSLDIFSIS